MSELRSDLAKSAITTNSWAVRLEDGVHRFLAVQFEGLIGGFLDHQKVLALVCRVAWYVLNQVNLI
jgi:hypothetical protein